MPIRSFRSDETEVLYREGKRGRWGATAKVALRTLDMLNAALKLEDLRSPPGNRLERLKGDRSGQYSIRINDQWRICFRWTAHAVEEVEIVDYH